MDRFKEILRKIKWPHVVAIVGLIAAFSYYSLDPSEIEVEEQAIEIAKVEISGLEKKLKETEQFEREVEVRKKRYAELVSELTKVQGALPRQFFLPDLLTDLLNEASQLQVEITKVVPDQMEKDSELFKSLGFTIDARGTFLQFFIFLDRLARMKRLVNVESFTVQKDGDRKVTLGGDEGAFGKKLSGGRIVYPAVTGQFRVVTYRYKSGAAAPSPSDAAQGEGK